MRTVLEPEPDVAVVDGAPRDYRDRHPQAARLIVEVSDTTLAYDRGRKRAAYARAGIAEYWVLDLAGGALEVCGEPNGEQYARMRRLGVGERVEWAGQWIGVDELLP
jgi:Uma2 family endonuclease